MAEPYMTMAEIEAKYPNEWVLIANPTERRWTFFAKEAELRKWGRLTGGNVVLHSPDRAEFLRQLPEQPIPESKHSVMWFMGEYPSNAEADELEPGAA